MFENLTDRLSRTLQNLRGQGRLSEDNIRDSLREVRMALLEADVALPVVKDFIEAVREKALGQDVISSLSPGQALIKVVNDELVSIMGEVHDSLDLKRKPPVIVLMAGLQGAGKTTTVANLPAACWRLRKSRLWWPVPTSIVPLRSNSCRRWRQKLEPIFIPAITSKNRLLLPSMRFQRRFGQMPMC